MPILHKELDRIGFYRHGAPANRGPLDAVGALGCNLVSLVVNPALSKTTKTENERTFTQLEATLPKHYYSHSSVLRRIS